MRKHKSIENVPAPLTVYYDGACVVCCREMRFYARRAPQLRLIDISAPDFDSRAHGLPHSEFMAKMHARDAYGDWYVGIDALRAVWRIVPGHLYDVLADVVGWPFLRTLAEWGYRLFARYRHLLPRTAGPCDGDSCRWPRV